VWWSRESRERRKEALAQRPHIKEAFAEAAPISQEIDDLLRTKAYLFGQLLWRWRRASEQRRRLPHLLVHSKDIFGSPTITLIAPSG
jgi:hypothetical protein